MFSQRLLSTMAARAAAVVRQGKDDVVTLLWTMVLGFGGGGTGLIAGLRLSYERASGRTTWVSGAGSEGTCRASSTWWLPDVTVLGLHKLLAQHLAGLHPSLAGDALGALRGRRSRCEPSVGEGDRWRRQDVAVLRVDPSAMGRLMLFDLGYYGFSLFECIDRNRGYCINRLKDVPNPNIVAVSHWHRGCRVPGVGEWIRAVLAHLDREVLDVDVEVRFECPCYASCRRTVRNVFHLFGIRVPETGEHHLYVTNVGVEDAAAVHVQRTYALHWQIELLFRGLKSYPCLEELPSRKPEVVKGLGLCRCLHAAREPWPAAGRVRCARRRRTGPEGASLGCGRIHHRDQSGRLPAHPDCLKPLQFDRCLDRTLD